MYAKLNLGKVTYVFKTTRDQSSLSQKGLKNFFQTAKIMDFECQNWASNEGRDMVRLYCRISEMLCLNIISVVNPMKVRSIIFIPA